MILTTDFDPTPYRRSEFQSRAVLRDETDAMLDLMCRCFEIDVNAAKTIFYSDPFFDLSMKRVLVDPDTGAIVSCLTLIPTWMRLNSATVLPICGVAGVCTEPARRKRGLAGALIADTLNAMPGELNYGITALTAARPAYYEQLGWELCGTGVSWSAPISKLPNYGEGRLVYEVPREDLPNRVPEIHALYATLRGKAEPGAFLREERRWRCIEKLTAGRRIAVFEPGNSPTAYAAYDLRVVEGVNTAYIHEIVARNPGARRAILGFFASGRLDIQSVAGFCSKKDAVDLGLMALTGLTFETVPSVYMRLSHLTNLLSRILARTTPFADLARFAEGICIRVEGAPPMPEDPGRASTRIKSFGRHVKTMADMSIPSTVPFITGDVGAVTQMVLGVKRATELVSEGRLRASSVAVRACCDALFPPMEPFLAMPDVF